MTKLAVIGNLLTEFFNWNCRK